MLWCSKSELKPASDVSEGLLAKHLHCLVSECRTWFELAIAFWLKLKTLHFFKKKPNQNLLNRHIWFPAVPFPSQPMKVLLKRSCNGYHRVNWSWSCSPITCLFVQYKPYFSLFLMKDASCCVWSALSPRGILFRIHLWWIGLLSEPISSKLSWLLSNHLATPHCNLWQPPVSHSAGTGHGAPSARNPELLQVN